MATECIGARMKDESDGMPSVPPGFVSLTSFTLQRVEENALSSACSSNSIQNQMELECSTSDDGKFKKSLRHRPWVNYSQFDNSSEEDESDYEFIEQDVPPMHLLPKGVIRGCAECSNCQQVTAKWHPEGACRPVLDEAPAFYPTEEEFKDTLKYIASIRPKAEPYGICRIVPPPSWKPPCPLKEKGVWENTKFVTRIQKLHKLQNRESVKKMSRNCSFMKRKRRKLLKMGVEYKNNNENVVEANELGYCNNAGNFGFEPGPDFTLETFQKYANFFKEQYFRTEDSAADLMSGQWEPSTENIEGEYWRIVERPTEDIEVLYGADLETGVFGSGFPKASSVPLGSDIEDQYVKSGWNLNNFPRLPGSVLSFESGDISGVLVPWLYIGMCFSSFCWHVEDHHLYSLNYLHWGAPKMWYGVPGIDALKLEAAMKKHLADLFEEQPDLLHNLVTQFSPSRLKQEGVPVYRCLQHAGEFVLTFPRAYHSGFNCGFNCAEAVNVAPIDWLPHGQNAIELYREQVRKISISHDKLLLGAAREAVRAQWNILFLGKNTLDNLRWKDACGPDGILAKSLKARVEMERVRREFLCTSQSRKMDVGFDANSERECVVCHYDLHFSATGCPCSPDRFACLTHSKQLCSCSWNTRFFLLRYEISELNILVDALGGKLSAVHRWGLSDLGLSLSSFVTREKTPESKCSNRTSSPEATKQNDKGRLTQGILLSSSPKKYTSSSQEIKTSSPQKSSIEGPKGRGKLAEPYSLGQLTKPITVSISKEPDLLSSSSFNSSVFSGQRNQIISSHQAANIISNTVKNVSASDRDVILLTDDEHGGGAQVLPSDKVKEAQFVENPEALNRLIHNNDKATTSNSQKDRILVTPETTASVISERDNDLQPLAGKLANVSMPASNLPNQCLVGSFVENASQDNSSFGELIGKLDSENMCVKEEGNCSSTSIGSPVPHQQLAGSGNTDDESKAGKSGSDSVKNLNDRGESVTASSYSLQNSLDRPKPMQKGPRMAKMVRRINCIVEPLEYGVVFSGKLWSTSQAIFPKGYRSRVRYLSILDPTQMSYYVSEILDAGLLGPLFMVKLENCPSEVFIHVSATKCWNMVRERVNHEIRRQHSLGRLNLPSLQPPGSLDGLEMFGLTTPTILQAIEVMDNKHSCSEYWRSRPKPPTTSNLPNSPGITPVVEEERSLLGRADVALRGLFRKANSEELQALHRALSSDEPSSKKQLMGILNEEIERCPR